MKNLIHSFVFAAIAVFMSAMSAKAQNGPFVDGDDLKLMVATVNMQLGVPDMLKTEHFASLKGGDASNKFAQANGLKTASISGRYTFVPRGSKINKAGNPKDTTMTVLLADANKLMGRAYAGTNMVFLYGYDKIKQTFLFITKYEDTGAAVAQAQQTPAIPTPQPSAQPVPVQQLTPAQQAFMDQVAYAMKGGVILDRSVAQDGHGHMTVKDSLGRITTFDVTAGTVLYSSNPSLAPATGVSGPAVGQPYGATAQASVTQQASTSNGPTPEEERLGYYERMYPSGLKKFKKNLMSQQWEIQEDLVAEELVTPDLRRNQPVYIRNAEGKLVRDLDERARQARLVDGKYNLATGAPTRASEIQEANRGVTIVNGGYGYQGGWSNGYYNNCYPNGGGGNGSQMVVGNTYTGFQASVGGW